MQPEISLFWFRRDLRLEDNHGLFQALQSGLPVLPVFIFDTQILSELHHRRDARVEFIHQQISHLQKTLLSKNSTLVVKFAKPLDAFRELVADYRIKAVFTNEDYEPYARRRDKEIAEYLQQQGVGFHSFKDQLLFAKDDIVKDDGRPYSKFTPYSVRWKAAYASTGNRIYPSEKLTENFFKHKPISLPSLQEIGFLPTDKKFPEAAISKKQLELYAAQRDIPALDATSKLSVHLRFGTISIRQLCKQAAAVSNKFLDELIWREFYQMILWFHPHVVHSCFRPEFDKMIWRNNEQEFQAWCEGKTGFPLVDAGMRELNATGFMHNRVRMVTASFLTKHLLIDWRWGEAYFAEKLLDYDLASNNGGWQWAAGTGCDAMPYFRFFNPALQEKKFDPERIYIQKWIPEINTPQYPTPIVAHELARERGLLAYKRCAQK